jgi:hypothetical protein
MAQDETNLLKRLQLKVSPAGWRLFRNLVGGAWMGRVTEEINIPQKGKPPLHVIELVGAYRVTVGLGTGSSDAVGWRTVTITEDMVGKPIAQFVAAELKTLKYKKATDEQKNFLQQVADAGGLAMIVNELPEGEFSVKEILPK